VIDLDDVLDPWIDAFVGSAFSIHARVGLESTEDLLAVNQTSNDIIVQDFRLSMQSTSFAVNSLVRSTELMGNSQRESILKFCPCGNDDVCFGGPVALSHLNSVIRICLVGPNHARIKMSSIHVMGMQLSIPSPRVLIEYDGTNMNLAFIMGQLPLEFLETDYRGITISGTTSILTEDGREIKEGFLIHYTLNALTLSPGIADKTSSNARDRVITRVGSTGSTTLQACQCNGYNMCEKKTLIPKSRKVKLCILAEDSSIVQLLSMGLSQKNGNRHTVRFPQSTVVILF
jgi:hypothetical protein